MCLVGSFGIVPCFAVLYWVHGKDNFFLNLNNTDLVAHYFLSRHRQPFIKTQIARNDLENSLFFNPDEQPLIDDLEDESEGH